jgi:predicted  nucleic acid-binding Zn-ribbon protein
MLAEVSLREIHGWLIEVAHRPLTDIEKRLKKYVEEFERTSATLRETCERLRAKSERSMVEKREDRGVYKAARAANRLTNQLLESTRNLSLPEEISYDALKRFEEVVARTADESIRIRDYWAAQIKPYYMIDMMTINGMLDKLSRLATQLRSFSNNEATPLRYIHEIKSKADEVSNLKESLAEMLEAKGNLNKKIEVLQADISRLRALQIEIEQDPRIKDLAQTRHELVELRSRLVSHELSRLKRPLRKLRSIAERGEYPLPNDQRLELSRFLRKPLTALLAEEEGYALIKAIFSHLQKAVSDGKLRLKQRDERKILQRIESIVKANSLLGIQISGKQILAQRASLLSNKEVLKLSHRSKELVAEISALELRKRNLENEVNLLCNRIQMTKQRIQDARSELEALAARVTGREIRIKLDAE